MEFERTSFYPQYLAITAANNALPTYEWSAVIVANGVEIETIKVVDQDVIRDYANNYADLHFISVLMLAGDYILNVYPYHQDLELVLYKKVAGVIYGDSSAASSKTLKMTYKAVLKSTMDVQAVMTNGVPFDKDAADLTPPLTVQFDLMRKPVMQLRMVMCGQTFREEVPGDVVKGLLTKASREVTGNQDELILGIDMHEPNNQTRAHHVIIPQPTALVDLPGYIQKNCNGIYTNGIGFFIQGNWWYVYAPFDVSRFNRTQKTLTVIRVPQNRFEGIDRTWSLIGDNLTILSASTFSKNNNTAQQMLSDGVGVRYAEADKFMNGFVQVKDNKAVVSRKENNAEFGVTDRKDGFNRAMRASVGITSNACAEQSKISMKNGSVATIVWTHSEPELIYPCMPVRMVLMNDDTPVETDGVVLMSDTQYWSDGNGVASARHKCTTTLHIFYKP